MTKVFKLVNGRIPANTVCPFRGVCPNIDYVFPGSTKKNNFCYHTGVNHNVPYQCNVATKLDSEQ